MQLPPKGLGRKEPTEANCRKEPTEAKRVQAKDRIRAKDQLGAKNRAKTNKRVRANALLLLAKNRPLNGSKRALNLQKNRPQRPKHVSYFKYI